jgi:glutamine synthetase
MAQISIIQDLANWMQAHAIQDVECITADMNGVPRGKIIPADRFLKMVETGRELRMPEIIYAMTITGDYPEEDVATDPRVIDINFVPDLSTARLVPWYDEPTAQVICDAVYVDGTPVAISARQVLKHVMNQYKALGLTPVVAPEVEFYLVDKNLDPDLPLQPPIGRSGRRATAKAGYGIEAANEYDPIIEDIYEWADAQDLQLDTLSHESGTAQMEINFEHGDPVERADQTMLFKRTVREAALKHDIYATFMAKPIEDQPGSALHLHVSVIDQDGNNIFATEDGVFTEAFMHYIGGLQHYMAAAMPLLAPNVNSYRRFRKFLDAPINTHWSQDNRTVGLRVPLSDPQATRVENRVAGADANPYLATAATLACGLLGLMEKIDAQPPVDGDAYTKAHTLPRTLYDALWRFNLAKSMHSVLGEAFVVAVNQVKETELDHYQGVISSWEREYLLLNV